MALCVESGVASIVSNDSIMYRWLCVVLTRRHLTTRQCVAAQLAVSAFLEGAMHDVRFVFIPSRIMA